MSTDPFEVCWDRLERATSHRVALAEVWNEYIDTHPYDFRLNHKGHGVHVLEVMQTRPIPSDFALELGEWLYNARSCLDYIVWATSAYVTGAIPPPKDGVLQYPIYETPAAWESNMFRLRGLADHHRAMLHQMQPYNGDADANYLGWVNRLARIDRHRRLTISTAYLAEVEPVIQVPSTAKVTLQWGQRVLVDGYAAVARVTVKPWAQDTALKLNPRIGIDPEITEWAKSPFWRRVRFGKRLRMIQLFLESEVAVYEYDCTGKSRKLGTLTDDYRAECDARGPYERPTPRRTREVRWGPPVEGSPSTEARFRGEDFQ